MKFKQEASIKLDILSSIVNCEQSPLYTVRPDLLTASRAVRESVECEQRHLWRCIFEKMKSEPEFMKSVCKAHKHVAIKTIRVRLHEVRELLTSQNDDSIDWKVIHVVRDPRGMINSWMGQNHRSSTKYFEEETRSLCKEISSDVRIGQELEKLYPNSYMLLRYEDLAANPYTKAQEMYNFIGIPMSDRVKQWIADNTNQDTSSYTGAEEKRMGQFRRDSKATSLAWEKILPNKIIRKIEKNCLDLMNLANYKPLYLNN